MAGLNFAQYAADELRVLNDGGGKGYDHGIRVFNCPLCGDRKGRGWLGITNGVVGCYNAGCDGDPRLAGGAIELFRRVHRLPDRAAAYVRFRELYASEAHYEPPPKPFSGRDFCRWPLGSKPFEVGGNAMQVMFVEFAEAQWGLSLADLVEWGCRWAIHGDIGWRLAIPVVMDGAEVGWQARSVRGVEPKYLTSRHGDQADPRAQCGRPAAAMLFNADAVPRGGEILLVEGAADTIAWHRRDRSRTPTGVGLLGMALTQEKAAIIASLEPERVVVALDDEPDARLRARRHVDSLRGFGIDVAMGRWVGGKDAGSGASLEVNEVDDDLLSRVQFHLGGRR